MTSWFRAGRTQFLSDEELFIYIREAFHLQAGGDADEEQDGACYEEEAEEGERNEDAGAALAALREAAAQIAAAEGTGGSGANDPITDMGAEEDGGQGGGAIPADDVPTGLDAGQMDDLGGGVAGEAGARAGPGPVAEGVEDLSLLSLRAQAAGAGSRVQSGKRPCSSSSAKLARPASGGLGGLSLNPSQADVGQTERPTSAAGSRPLSRQSSVRSATSNHTTATTNQPTNARPTAGHSPLTAAAPAAPPSPALSRQSSRGRAAIAGGSGPPSRSASRSRLDLPVPPSPRSVTGSVTGSTGRGARPPSCPPSPSAAQSRSVSRGRERPVTQGAGPLSRSPSTKSRSVSMDRSASVDRSASKGRSAPSDEQPRMAISPYSQKLATSTSRSRPTSNPRGSRSRSVSRDGGGSSSVTGSSAAPRVPPTRSSGALAGHTSSHAPVTPVTGSNLSEGEHRSLVFMWSLIPIVEGYLTNLRMWLGVVLAGFEGAWEGAREQAVLDARCFPSKEQTIHKALEKLAALEAQLAGVRACMVLAWWTLHGSLLSGHGLHRAWLTCISGACCTPPDACVCALLLCCLLLALVSLRPIIRSIPPDDSRSLLPPAGANPCTCDPMCVHLQMAGIDQQLEAVQALLAKSQKELAASQDELTASQDELAASRGELAKSRDELAESKKREAEAQAQAEAKARVRTLLYCVFPVFVGGCCAVS